jgi:hypothetical protein
MAGLGLHLEFGKDWAAHVHGNGAIIRSQLVKRSFHIVRWGDLASDGEREEKQFQNIHCFVMAFNLASTKFRSIMVLMMVVSDAAALRRKLLP